MNSAEREFFEEKLQEIKELKAENRRLGELLRAWCPLHETEIESMINGEYENDELG